MLSDRSSKTVEGKETVEIFMIDLDEIEWDISFSCPSCGEAIFPEDKSGRYYNLLEIRIKGRVVKEAVIQCAKRGGIISLAIDQSTRGFSGSFVLTRTDVDSDMLESCYSISYG